MYGGFAAGLVLLLLCTVQFQRETGKGGEEGSQYVKPTYVSSKFNNCCPFEWHHFGHVDFFGQWQNNNTLSRGGVYWKSPGPLWPLGANCLRGHIFQFIPTWGSVLPFFFPERECIGNNPSNRITVKSKTPRIRPLSHLKWFSQSFLDLILRDILIFQCSRPFRNLFRLPFKLMPATVLQALATLSKRCTK